MQDADWSTTNLKKAHLSTSKLRAATKLWRSFNPECSVSRGRITSDELSFEVGAYARFRRRSQLGGQSI